MSRCWKISIELLRRGAYTSWRKKFRIGEGVEIYYDVDIRGDTYFPGNIVLCRGFLEVGLRLPLNPLVISVMNYFQQAPIQLTCPSFVSLVVFDCINSHKDYMNGHLDISHFMYYFRVGRSSGSKKTKKSPMKKNWR